MCGLPLVEGRNLVASRIPPSVFPTSTNPVDEVSLRRLIDSSQLISVEKFNPCRTGLHLSALYFIFW
jgi:hypothetical protein